MTPNQVQIIIEAINKFGPAFSELAGELKTIKGKLAIVSAEFMAVKMAAQATFSGIAAVMGPAMDAIEEYRRQVVMTAAMITSFQGNKGNVGENYRLAKEYGEALYAELERIDAKTIASAQDLALITEEMVKQRVVLDINNQRQLEGFTNIANAVAVVSIGYPAKEVQLRQEVRALMLGQVDAQSQLAGQVNAMVGGGLKEKVALWKKEGTLIEHIGELLTGYAAASGDIQALWSAIKSTMATIVNQILRGGFSSAFSEIVTMAQQFGEYLKAHKEEIQSGIHKAWLAVKGLLETVDGLLESQGPLLKLLSLAVIKIFDGWGMILYVVLPPLVNRFNHILKQLNAMVNLGYAFGMAMFHSLQAVGSAVVKIGKATAQALTGDFEGAGKTLGSVMAGSFSEKLRADMDVVKGAMIVIGEEGAALKGGLGSDMMRRYDEYTKKIAARNKTAQTPVLPPPPPSPGKDKKGKKSGGEEDLPSAYAMLLKDTKAFAKAWEEDQKKLKEDAAWKSDQIHSFAEATAKMLEKERQIREAEIQYQLALVDTAEAYHEIGQAEAADKRLALNRELLESYEKNLAAINKATDPTGWLTQSKAVEDLRRKLLELGKTAQALSQDMAGGIREGFAQYRESIPSLFTSLQEATKSYYQTLESSFANLFDNILRGKVSSWADFFTQVGNQILSLLSEIMAKMTMASLTGKEGGWGDAISGIVGAVGSMFGGGAGVNVDTWGGIAGGLMSNAKGGVYASPSLSRYSGSVVNRPTLFTFAYGGALGVMGEGADPEGIFPLARDRGGKLGVRAVGGGGSSPTIHLHINAIDTQSGIQFLMKNSDAIMAGIASKMGDNHPLRRGR